MIQARAIYKHRERADYLLTDWPNAHPVHCNFITCRPLTRDLNVPGGFVLEQHHVPAIYPVRWFEKHWEYLRDWR